MKTKSFFLLMFFLPIVTNAQSSFQKFIAHVNSLSGSTQEKTAAVDSFMNYARSKGIPFIEQDTAYFIYRGNVQYAAVTGDFNSWTPAKSPMKHIPGTDFFYFAQKFEQDARVEYKLKPDNGSEIQDPENPHKVSGGFGFNSELAMPGYVQPWEIEYKSSIPHGSLNEKSLYSTYAKRTYRLKVYLPEEYSYNLEKHYPVIYLHDGFDYIDYGRALNVLDNLIDSAKIEPVIAVFLQYYDRADDYTSKNRQNFRKFVSEELVSFIDSDYRTERTSSSRVIAGVSSGANISLLTACFNSSVFGKCGIFTGAFNVNNYEALNTLSQLSLLPVKFFSVRATYDFWFSYDMNRLKQILDSKGYEYKWTELPQGHTWGTWRSTLDEMLAYFFPKTASEVRTKDSAPGNGFSLQQNYPNPFNPSTEILFSIPEKSFAELKVYDLLGREVSCLFAGELKEGLHSAHFDAAGLSSGIYYYTLKAGCLMQTRKMMLLQ
ncbi:MAG TPA: alpha/beta hydrolase-fold protein [Ignavibacteriales bacterium]|nr:alpha/beta hydrolase-fold protein [Ignavibacteriales bacterium]